MSSRYHKTIVSPQQMYKHAESVAVCIINVNVTKSFIFVHYMNVMQDLFLLNKASQIPPRCLYELQLESNNASSV